MDINTSVVNENNQPNHDALSNITTSAAAPAAGETIYKYCDGKLAWTLDSANYAITGILVDGAPLAADELAAAKAGDSITIPEMAADKDVVIVVREPALIEVAVSKTVSGAYGDKTGLFDFTIYFLGPGGAPLAEGTRIGYIGGAVAGSGAAAPDNGTLILDGDRKATIALGHGQTITFGVGSGTAIRIVESDHSGYAATFIDSADVGATHSADTGLREIVNGSRTFDYTNTRSSVLPTGVSTGSGGKFHLVLLVLLVVAAASVCRASVCAGRARHEGDG